MKHFIDESPLFDLFIVLLHVMAFKVSPFSFLEIWSRVGKNFFIFDTTMFLKTSNSNLTKKWIFVKASRTTYTWLYPTSCSLLQTWNYYKINALLELGLEFIKLHWRLGVWYIHELLHFCKEFSDIKKKTINL